MLNGNGIAEIAVHIARASESKYHASLIIVAEKTSSVPIQCYIDIVIKHRHVRQAGRAVVSCIITPVQISIYRPFSIAHQNVISHQVQLPHRICGLIIHILLLHITGAGIDKSLMIHVGIVILCGNEGL